MLSQLCIGKRTYSALSAIRERPLAAISLLHKLKKNPNSHSELISPSAIEFPTRTTVIDPVVKSEWTPIEKRTGVLAIKKGMVSIWDSWGQLQPVTVLQLEDTFVIGHRRKEQHGYDALIIGCRRKEIKTKEDVKSYLYHIETCMRAQIGMCLEKICEFKISPEGFVPVGTVLNAAHFTPGQFIDVQAKSKDKGFQGVVKRWGFKGQSASHGTSLAHRSGGSIGQRKDPGKVFKGRKMPGHMGGEHVTVNNLQVLKVDKILNLIYVKGSIPGENSFVKVRDALFKQDQFDPYKNPPAFPTITSEELEQLPVEWELGQNGEDPIATKYKL